ncbi:pyrroline-5-carboxylate reductase [Paludisphaera mucosa]|uniref:Pyrroline-5-carboxylate reductase n=1 Tax=Paludisphaera mucosa TaxID=3030827 RepID=A0ABT6FCY0_9BACT|nr:pyrroline-5-carboxylate reductase [Paludisphaera mucosa]MDG3005248.1 pyrroline-5-carboxylate reductase [Paludisphaera mucosa]
MKPPAATADRDALRWGFIGSGRMASALVKGMIRAGVATPDRIVASDPQAGTRDELAREAGIAVHASNSPVVEASDAIVLAVKPQSMASVLAEIAPMLAPRHLIVSIAAGVGIGAMRAALGASTRIVRVMPNTPALLGEGASAYALGPDATDADAQAVQRFLDSVGRSVRVPESQLDAVTGLSGSGPAFVYMVIEALSDGGVRAGLPRDVATTLAAQTVLGAAKMVLETGLHPGALKDQVTSPGGTTIAGVQVLERAALRGALIDAVDAAARRSAELAGPARP